MSSAQDLDAILSTADKLEEDRDYEAAAQQYALAVQVWSELRPDRPTPSELLERFAHVARAARRFEQAVAVLEIMFRQLRDADDMLGAAVAAIRSAEVALEALDFRSARRFLERAEQCATAEAMERATLAQRAEAELEREVVLGRLARAEGRTKDAEANLRRAKDVASKTQVRGRVHRAEDDLALMLAQNALDRGDLEAFARCYSMRALDSEAAARWSVLAARHATMTGALSDATMNVAHERDPVRKQRALVVAHALIALNRVAEAIAAIDTALAHDVLPDATSRSLAELRLIAARRRDGTAAAVDIASVPAALDAVSGSTMTARVVSAIPPEGRTHDVLFEDWVDAVNGMVRAIHERAQTASVWRARMTELANVSDSEYVAAKTTYFDCVAARNFAGELDGAGVIDARVDRLKQVLELFDAKGLAVDAWHVVREIRALRALGPVRDHELLARLEEELERRSKQITSRLGADDRVMFLLDKWSAWDEFVSTRGRSLDEHRTRARAPSKGPLGFLRKVWANCTLASKVRAFHSEVSSKVGWTAIRALDARAPVPRALPLPLASNEAVIQFHALPDRLLVFVATRRRMSYLALPVTRAKLWPPVKALQSAAAAAFAEAREVGAGPDLDRRRARLDALLEEVASLLALRAICARLVGIDRLLVVPHDILVNLPWAALPIGAGEAMVDRFITSLAPHPSWPAPKRADALRPLVFGVSRFDSLAELANVRKEAEAVAQVLGTGAHVDESLDADELVALFESSDRVHVATHGRFDVDRPLESGLAHRTSRGTEWLTIERLEKARLAHAPRVFLSGCWTADVLVLPGQELLGLPPSFLRAGARSVIAALWRVDDDIGAQFTEEFYAEQADDAEALARLQRRWRKDEDPLRNSLYAWGSYLCYGR